MPDEDGYQVASAYVTVTPDASDFPDALDEQIGGLTVSVRVLPDASDLQGAIDQEDLTAGVRLTANAAGLQDQVDEQAGDLTASIRVGADVAPARSEVASVIDDFDSARADLTLGADTGAGRAQAEAFAGDLSGLSADVTLGADIGGASAGVERLTGDIDQLAGSSSQAQSELGGLAGTVSSLHDAADHAASSLSGISGVLAGVAGGVSVQLIPDASGFAERVASDAEGLTVGVGLVPDNADEFRQAIEEEAGGAEVSVSLSTAIPNADEFRQAVDEQVGGMSVGVSVVPEGGGEGERGSLAPEESPAVSVGGGLDAAEEQADGLAGALGRVGDAGTGAGAAVADGLEQAERAMRDVDAVVDQAVRRLGNLQAVADGGDWTSGLSAAEGKLDVIGEKLGSLNAVWADMFTASASGEGDLTAMAQEADELTGSIRAVMPAANEAIEAVAGIEGAYSQAAEAARTSAAEEAAANEEAAERSLAGWTSAVEGFVTRSDSILGGLRITLDSMMAAPPTDGWLESAEQVGERVDALRSKMSAVSDVAQSIGQDIAAGGGDFASMQGDAARVDEVIGTMKGDVLAVRDAAMDVRTEFITMAGDSGAGGAASAVSDIGGAADGAAEAAGGLGGVFGELAGRLSYMAVDPFMWMMAVPMMIGPIEQGIKSLGDAMNPVSGQVQELHQQVTAQTDALGYSVEGWKNLAESEKAYGAATGSPLISQETNTAVKDLSEGAANLSGNISDLGRTLHVSHGQVVQLAEGAGVSAKQLSAQGDAGETARAKIAAYAQANLSATGPVGELSGDLMQFGDNMATAALRTSSFDDAYNLLVGNFTGSWQAQLSTAQGFLTLKSDADAAGASMTGTNQASVALQQQFGSQVTSIDSTVDAMVKQKDSTQEVNTYLQDQIDKLSGYAGDSAPAQYALGQLRALQEGVTQATQATTQAQETAASEMAGQFTAQVRSAGDHSSTTAGYVNALKTSILDTGTTSQQTANDRAELIADLEKFGVHANTAKSMVAGFIAKINAIPKTTNWNLTEHATGTWTEQQISSAINLPGSGVGSGGGGVRLPGHATGGLMQGGSGSPTADDIPARLSSGEYVVSAGAVGKYGVGMMDQINAGRYADGGLAGVGGSYSGSASGLGSWNQSQYGAAENALANTLIGSANSAGQAAATAASSTAGAVAGALSGASGSVQAMAQKAAAALGWTGAQWAALNAVEMAEAGWNLTATNPTSGAYGIAQFIGGAGEYAQYGGNANTAAGQIAAWLAYVQQRYGTPEAAEQHEQQFHWYKDGGRLNPGQRAVVGDGGEPEVVTAGMSGATVTPMGRGGNTVNVNFYGPQYPSAETIANLKSELAFALVGAP